MPNLYHRRSKRQLPRVLCDSPLAFSEYAEPHSIALTRGGSYLCHRKNIRPAIADVVAELMGLGTERNS
jgi:hypothetical protein